MKIVKNRPLIEFSENINVTYPDGSPVKTKNLEKKEELAKEILCQLTTENGQKIAFKSRTMEYRKKLFISPFPNPILLMLNTSISCYNKSVEILEFLPKDSQLINEEKEVYVLRIGENLTNENYNSLIQNKIISVISLVTALEAFLNDVIPNDFIYKQSKNGSIRHLNKNKIESSKVYFKEKLTEVISQVLDKPNFKEKNKEIINQIVNIYNVRKEIVHLKTNSEDLFDVYFKSIGEILDADIKDALDSVISYMNLVSKNYIR